MTKVKVSLTPYELHALDALLTEVMALRPEDDAERCAVVTLQFWHAKKVRPLVWFPKPDKNNLTIEAPVAFALRALMDFTALDPREPLDIKLLQLSDSIQKTFISPIS